MGTKGIFCFVTDMRLLILIMVALLADHAAIAGETPDWRTDLMISLDDKSEQTIKAKAQLLEALKTVGPPKKGEQMVKISNGQSVLYGDLFRQGKAYAVVELVRGSFGESTGDQIGLGFAVWNGRGWEPRGLWRICPGWRSAGTENSDSDSLPDNVSDRPFWIEKLCGLPSVIVAGEIERWDQEFYLFCFDKRIETLRILERSERKPEMVDGYVRFLHSSGRKADWEEWLFWNSNRGGLLPLGAWKADSSNPENPSWVATTYDVTGQRAEVYLIECNQNDCSFKITRNGGLYAKVNVSRRDAPGTSDESEEAYLFQKLTKLPRKLYSPDGPGANPKRLEDIAEIKVSGDSEAVRKLSP